MKLLHLFFIFLFLIIFNGCGSDGTSSTNKTKIGFFVDSLVDGVEYQCGDINGITGDVNGKGSFRYQEDCSVKFNIGKMYLGEVSGDDISNTNSGKKVFITNILGLNTTDTSDVRLWNILRLLQTLDTDDNLSNGILISNTVRDNLNRTDVNSLDFTQTVSVDELNSTVIKADSNKNLRTITQALTHFEAELAVDTVGPPTPFLTKDLTKIKTIHTIKRTVEINGEEGSKIFLGFNSDGNNSNINFKDQNLTINSTWKQKLSLTFNDDNITNFHYYIILQDNKEHNSSILHLNILKDFTPPHVKSAIIIKHVIEEQRLFENIFATDNSGMDSIKYKIVTSEEDNNSFDYTLFTIDINGSVTFLENPNYEENIGRIYQIVARAIDTSGNMTDVIIQVSLINILDNPPKLNANNYNTAMIEGEANNFIVYDLNSTLEENLTIAQDNDPTLSPISFLLHNHTDIFDLNISTGKLTIKDNTNALFDYEQSPNSIDLNISVENNNTKVARNGDLNATYTILTIDINNKIDTPPSLISPNSVLIDERNDPGIIDIVTISKDTANSDRNLSMLFSIVNGADGKFDINSTTGLIKTNGDNLDFETKPQYILTIRAINIWEWDNNSTHYDEVNLTINLNNVIDNPPIIIYKDLNNSIPESTPINFQIAQLETNGTIYDENQTTSYQIKQITKNGSILNIDTAPFTIDSNGIVSTSRELLKDYIETLNHLTDTVFNFQLNAYNIYWNGEQNTSNIVSFDINITKVIDNFPILKQAATKTFEENISVGTIVNTVETNSDIYDENNVTRFSIKSGNDDNIFNINNTTGEIKIQNPLDWETTISYTLEVIASNIYFDSSEHNSSTMFFDIAITNIIEKVPQITTLTSIDVHENIDADFTISVLETNSTQVDEQTIDSFTIISGNDGNFS
ncbi:MAG: cadherin repeat domain-containing protein, partial [Arcobacteraceae bacterium]|nr:cadherin repeat domain-containing protein [Arcobacteraceae bacterium]